MDSETVWVGMDLGQRETHVCVVDDFGKTVHEQVCETSNQAIVDALSKVPKDRIGLIAVEAGPGTHVVRKLRKDHYPVAIFESRKASKFLSIRSNKTDLGDAHGLADLGRLGQHTVSQVHLKSLECQQLRSQLIQRQKLVRMRVTAEHCLRSRLALHGKALKVSRVAGTLRGRVSAQLAELRVEEGIDLRDDVAPLVDVCESMTIYLKRLDKAFAKQAAGHPICSRLMKVAGIGPMCALSFYSAIEDPSRFNRASDVGAYLGLVPKRHQSGETSRTKGITRTGNKLTRCNLYTAALGFSRYGPDSELKQWAAALKERIGPFRSRVALARKLAILLLRIWKTGEHFEPYPSRSSPQALQIRKE